MTRTRPQDPTTETQPGTNLLAEFYYRLGHLARTAGWSWSKRREGTRALDTGSVSYWVVPGRLRAGTFPGSQHPAGSGRTLSSLVKLGIRVFIDLTEPGEVAWFGRLRSYQADLKAAGEEASAELFYSQFPIRDMDVPSRECMTSILDALDAALGVGVTYIHCVGGRGRTGTVLGCYLVRHAQRMLEANAGQDTGALALARIAELRAAQRVPFAERSPETRTQREFVLGWNRSDE